MQAQDLALFNAALGLTEPWQVTSVEFDPATKRLDLRIDSRAARRSAARSAMSRA
jgi:hypothetical protein